MLILKSIYLIFMSIVLRTTDSQRRIKDGKEIETDFNYMAYLIKAPHSPVAYDAWVCGGAIVHTEFIITSAACIEDVKFMYAIAGYKNYVNNDDIKNDKCANAAKKKVVLSCVPKNYELKYEKIDKWSFIDIGVVRVESPYDFSVTTPLPSCTWAPNKIEINYDFKYQQPGTDSIVLGWGHNDKWRQPNDPKDYNQPTLKYSNLLVQDKEECKTYYVNIDGMGAVIDKYMICAFEEGNINSLGKQIKRGPPTADGCFNNFVRIRGVCQSPEVLKNLTMLSMVSTQKTITPPNPNYITPPAQPDQEDVPTPVETYKSGPDDDTTITFDDIAFRFRRTEMGRTVTNFSRRVGICQNDHGGPLVTWAGRDEVLIGVASVFRINNHYECIGPFLFTSTQCNGAFLSCVINNMTSTRRNPICDLPPAERGFDIIERRISWRHHPDGPAANEPPEDLLDRPQYPLHSLHQQNTK